MNKLARLLILDNLTLSEQKKPHILDKNVSVQKWKTV